MRTCEGPPLRPWVDMGPAAQDAVPELVRLLKDPDAAVRRAAAEALGQIGPAAKDAVPELVKLLKDPDKSVRTGCRFCPSLDSHGGETG